MAYLVENQKMSVTNLKTGKSSKQYPEIHPAGGYSIFFEKKKWGILDTNLSEVKRFTYPKSAKDEMGNWENIALHRAAEWRFHLIFSEYHNEQPDRILITRKTIDQTKNQDHLGMDEIYGLLDLQTGKQIDVDYHWIGEVNFNGENYYWAYKYKNYSFESNPEYLYIDIYDSD